MKVNYLLLLILGLFFACADNSDSRKSKITNIKNEVLVLGTIHSKHLTEEIYNLDVLRSLIVEIKPDVILAEIPPDRFPIAMKEYLETDSITEPRVKRFPEYVDVIFPLLKNMDFEIIPTAGWTKPMADKRRQQLKDISEDSSRVAEWNQLQSASKKSEEIMEKSGRQYDPYWINSDAYDQAVEVELSVYNKLFNEELGLGGWDNINEAHFSYIAKALDKLAGQGKRVLITYGAGHKGWFLKALEKRDDIEIKSLQELTVNL